MAHLVYSVALVCLIHYGSATYSHNVGGGFRGSYGGSAGYGGGAYNGPLAAPVVLSNGHLADTNEVVAAKNDHLSALLSAKASSGYGGGYESSYEGGYGGSGSYGSGSGFKSVSGYGLGGSYGGGVYNGPLAAPVVLSSGYLADTMEVAAAKDTHYSALSSAKASYGYGSGYGSGYGGGYGGSTGYGSATSFKSASGYGSGSSYGGGAYNGPLAAPVVLLSGYLADTREVAAAKNAHYSALSTAKTSTGYGSGLSSGYGGGAGYGSGASYGGGAGASYGGGAYHGPLAAPVVLSSGYLADTRDVAAAKGAHYVALSDASSRSGYGGYSGSQEKGWH